MDETTEGDVDVMSDDSDTELVQMDETPAEKWDCESILSTYSNIYNHPKLITEPRKVGMFGIMFHIHSYTFVSGST